MKTAGGAGANRGIDRTRSERAQSPIRSRAGPLSSRAARVCNPLEADWRGVVCAEFSQVKCKGDPGARVRAAVADFSIYEIQNGNDHGNVLQSWAEPLTSLVRDEGVAGSNPATPTNT